MVKWVNSPGRAIVLPQPIDDFADVQMLLDSSQVDCVDGLLYNLALRLQDDLRSMPLVRVATYDATDFYRCMGKRGVSIEILNMREGF